MQDLTNKILTQKTQKSILKNYSSKEFLDLYHKLNPNYRLSLQNWMIYSLNRRVSNLFTWFFLLDSSFKKTEEVFIQSTLISKFFKNAKLTKKRIRKLFSVLLAKDSQHKMIILFPELHSCWKSCHWKDNAISKDWNSHNRNNCKCFLSESKKHWKCKLIWHSHNWQTKDLDFSQSLKDLSITEHKEQVSDIEKKLCYNMKDWGNYYLYPKKYKKAGLIFNQKWYWVLDSEKFLLDKEKKRIYNARYRLRANNESEKIANKLQKDRKNLLTLKSKTKSMIKKLSWDKKLERKVLIEKLEKINFKLLTSEKCRN